MSTGETDILLAAEDEGVTPAPGRPPWATRLSFAGTLFIATGGGLAVGVVLTHPMQNLDVLCAGVTLAVSGMVLRAICGTH